MKRMVGWVCLDRRAIMQHSFFMFPFLDAMIPFLSQFINSFQVLRKIWKKHDYN